MKKYLISASIVVVAIITVASATYVSAAARTSSPHSSSFLSLFSSKKPAVKKTTPPVSPVSITLTKEKTQLVQALTSRIGEYSEFKSAMPSSISSDDQTLLTTGLTSAITTMKGSITNLKAATTTIEINDAIRQSNIGSGEGVALLNIKMSMLILAFHASPKTHAHSSKVTFPAPSATTVVPDDVIDQIINLTSLSGAASLMQEVVGDVTDSSVATST